MEKSYFSSSVNRDDYALIRSEAFRQGKPVRNFISEIISQYAEKLRKEAGKEVDLTEQEK
jgi:hypothetical protein